MHTFAIYRLPFAKECTMLIQHSAPLVLSSLAELEGKKGFVIAPFNVSDKCPILLLQPNEVRTMPIKQVQSKPKEKQNTSENEVYRMQYHRDFVAFHKELTNNRFAKIVLALCTRTNSTQFKNRRSFLASLQRVSTSVRSSLFYATIRHLAYGNSRNTT